MNKSKIVITFLIWILLSQIANAQFVSRFSIFGGFTAGWYIPDISTINTELNKAGIPSLNTDGAVTRGGHGYLDVPKVTGLRLGYMGTGFTLNSNQVSSGNLKKKASLVYRMGGLSAEYVSLLGKYFDFTFGSNFGMGSYTVKLFQIDPNYGNWNTVFGEIGSNGSSQTISRNLRQTFYTIQPKVGIGFQAKSFLYFKFNTGYSFTFDSGWEDENGIELTNVPGNIKANGFFTDLSVNLGLFFR